MNGVLCCGVPCIAARSYDSISRTRFIHSFSSFATEYLDLGRNDFSSTLSADIGKLTMLDTLSLGEVSLTGTLPDTMIALTNMRRLRLEQSVMKGPIFNLMEYWPKMEDLDLSLSLFTGTIPTSIGVLNPSLKIV